jgi:hypothetical protein
VKITEETWKRKLKDTKFDLFETNGATRTFWEATFRSLEVKSVF